MDQVNNIFEKNNLIVRAMDVPRLIKNIDGLFFDCTDWMNEFELMKENKLTSVSSTLIIPNIPVKTYKNVGYLVDAKLVDCYHICKTDSGSNGNIKTGDFFANTADFQKIHQLANFIIENKHSEMNELNINLNINSVVGLFVNKCSKELFLLKRMLMVISALKKYYNIELPLYEYDVNLGKLTKIELSNELINQINENEFLNDINLYCFFSEKNKELYYGDIEEILKKGKRK